MFMIYVKIYAQLIKIRLKTVLVYKTKFIWPMLLMNSSISLFFFFHLGWISVYVRTQFQAAERRKKHSRGFDL